MTVKPIALKTGDTIGIIAPASGIKDKSKINKGIKFLKQHGFKVIEGKHIRKRKNFLATSDKERLEDLHDMYKNKNVKLILCMRGGYGTNRLLNGIDYELIKKNPKILAGFSDITGLSIAIHRKCNQVIFHSPMLTSNFANDNCPPYTIETFFKLICDARPAGSLLAGSNKKKCIIITKGKASGLLTGGNLATVVTTLGTPYEIITKNKIVFLEDVDEALYRVDRMLTHLLNAGKLSDAAGIVLGQFTLDNAGKNYNKELKEVLTERLGNLKIPVLMDFPFGHIPFTATIPYGIKATLDAYDKGDLIIEESAVK